MDQRGVRLRPPRRRLRHRLVDAAAEEEPRHRRAGPGQGRPAHRRPHRAAGHAEGPAAGLQPRPAGGQGAAVRRRRPGAPGPRPRSAAWSPRPPSTSTGCRPRPTPRRPRPPTWPSSSCAGGMPFREAHAVVGCLVRAVARAGRASLAELVAAHPDLGPTRPPCSRPASPCAGGRRRAAAGPVAGRPASCERFRAQLEADADPTADAAEAGSVDADSAPGSRCRERTGVARTKGEQMACDRRDADHAAPAPRAGHVRPPRRGRVRRDRPAQRRPGRRCAPTAASPAASTDLDRVVRALRASPTRPGSRGRGLVEGLRHPGGGGRAQPRLRRPDRHGQRRAAPGTRSSSCPLTPPSSSRCCSGPARGLHRHRASPVPARRLGPGPWWVLGVVAGRSPSSPTRPRTSSLSRLIDQAWDGKPLDGRDGGRRRRHRQVGRADPCSSRPSRSSASACCGACCGRSCARRGSRSLSSSLLGRRRLTATRPPTSCAAGASARRIWSMLGVALLAVAIGPRRPGASRSAGRRSPSGPRAGRSRSRSLGSGRRRAAAAGRRRCRPARWLPGPWSGGG